MQVTKRESERSEKRGMSNLWVCYLFAALMGRGASTTLKALLDKLQHIKKRKRNLAPIMAAFAVVLWSSSNIVNESNYLLQIWTLAFVGKCAPTWFPLVREHHRVLESIRSVSSLDQQVLGKGGVDIGTLRGWIYCSKNTRVLKHYYC